MVHDRVPPAAVRVNQEVYLGNPGAFADIRVQVQGAAPYFVEIKYGYPREQIIRHVRRKYGVESPVTRHASKLIVVIDAPTQQAWATIETDLRACLQTGLSLEVWDERHLIKLIHDRFGIQFDSIAESNVIDLRAGIDKAMGRYAFGDQYTSDPLQSWLLWHFAFWQLRELRETQGLAPTMMTPPRMYEGVAVLFADLCSYSSYMRDTSDDAIIRRVLTSFYLKARNQVLDTGGLLYQFQGDGVLALYGIPQRHQGYLGDALECAKALVDIGNSTSIEWQRHIDHVQVAAGAHVGMALGELQIVSLRPFAPAPVGAIADSINMAARLTATAGPSEIVVSNAFFQG